VVEYLCDNKHFSREGSFHTNGGATYCPDACYGSGGGGRVAIYYQSSSFYGTILSLGQHIYSVSQDGTVVFEKGYCCFCPLHQF